MERLLRRLPAFALSFSLSLLMGILIGSGLLGGQIFASPHRPAGEVLDSLLRETPEHSHRIVPLLTFLQANPGYFRAARLLWEALAVSGENERLPKILSDSLPASSPFGLTDWIRARNLLFENRPEEAANALRTALQKPRASLDLLSDVLTHQKPALADLGTRFMPPGNLPGNLGLYARAMRQLADGHATDAMETLKSLSPTAPQRIRYHLLKAHCLLEEKSYPEAREVLNTLWEQKETLPADLRAEVACCLGEVFLGLRDREKAVVQYETARAILNPLSDYQLQIALNQRLGYNLRYLDRYEEAAPLYRETIAMATAIRQRQDYGPLFLGEGQALYNLKSFHQALSAYDSAAVFFHEDADHDNLARVAGARGDLFKEVGQLDMALRTYDQARLEDPANDRFNMSIDRKIATILKSRGQLDAALDIFRSLLKKDPRSLSRSLTLWHIADIYSRLNRPDSAMANQQAGLKLAREASYSRYVVFHLRSMAEILSNMDRGTEALDTLKVALATAREGGYEEGIMEVQYAFGRIYDKNGDLKNAINAYQEAIRLIEKTVDLLGVEQVKIGYFSDLSQVYLSLAACYVRRYQSRQKSADLDSAFAFIELSRGRTLRDLRQEGHHQSAFKPGDPALQSYRRIETDLQRQQRFLRDYAIRPQAQPEIVDSLERQLTATRYALVASRLKLIQGNAPQKPHFIWPDYQAFRDQLQRSGFAGLIYQISPKATFVLASDGSRSTVIDLPADAVEIDSLVSKLIRPFHQFNASDMGETPFHAEVAHRLYQILIEPVEKAFDLPENLFIVPDIPLMGMPFEMLLDQKQPQSVYTPLEPAEYREDFLQNRYVFVYSPTATLLNPKASAAGRSSKMLIFANPFPETTRLYGQGSRIRSANEWVFEPLAFAEVEATNIRAANENAEIFTREQATEKLFMEIAPEYPIIHIATHGLVDQSFDAFSGLVLAEGDYLLEDGLLMGYELADLQLDCELVTLSACETGRGKEVAGEGVMGLPRLFIAAGARSVMMTHWKVEDQFTAGLMPLFYRFYINKGQSKAAALASARRMILAGDATLEEAYAHPLFWASFTLFGDPGLPAAPVGRWILSLLMSVAGVSIILLVIKRRIMMSKMLRTE